MQLKTIDHVKTGGWGGTARKCVEASLWSQPRMSHAKELRPCCQRCAVTKRFTVGEWQALICIFESLLGCCIKDELKREVTKDRKSGSNTVKRQMMAWIKMWAGIWGQACLAQRPNGISLSNTLSEEMSNESPVYSFPHSNISITHRDVSSSALRQKCHLLIKPKDS